MDPLTIVATAFSLAGAIAKATIAVTEFSRDARDASKDLDNISKELKALAAVLGPLMRSLSRARSGNTLPDDLITRIGETLAGCDVVVDQIAAKVQKYQRDKVWSKAKWAMFGQGDMQKLRESLEVYKIALSLGFHAISMSMNEGIKDDTEVIREYADAIKINTDEILERVNSIRRERLPGRNGNVERWIEEMTVLTSYAETTYQETVVDSSEYNSSPALSAPTLPREESRQEIPATPNTSVPDITTSNGQERSPTVKSGKTANILTESDARTIQPAKSQATRISFDRFPDFAKNVKDVVDRAQRDMDVIEKSRQRRQALTGNEMNLLDSELLSLCAQPSRATAARIRDVVLRGASVNATRALHNDIRQTAIDVVMNSDATTDCLLELLRCGAYLMTHSYQGLAFSPVLTLAAYRANEVAVWALCAADAEVNPTDHGIVCPKCFTGSVLPHGHFSSIACNTPLLAALHLWRVFPKKTQANWTQARKRIVLFLLENGAVANYTGCRKVSAEHRLYSPLTMAATSWFKADDETQYTILRALLDSGADADYGFYPDDELARPSLAKAAWPDARTYLWRIVQADHPKSLEVLFMAHLKSRPLRRDILGVLLVWAAHNSSSGCLRLLATYTNLADVSILHKLIFCWADNREVIRISYSQLSTAIIILMKEGANPHTAWEFAYWRKRSLLRKPSVKKEVLSAVELLERIDTSEDENKRQTLITGIRGLADSIAKGTVNWTQ